MLQGSALAEFKSTDWHQQIKLIRGALRSEDYTIPTSDLLKLAGNELIDSRLINSAYDVEFGPLNLEKLPEKNLLILESLDSHVDSTESLLRKEFSFLPAWQIDDAMVSVGSDGASCGPHFDRYDVFLIQVSGTKTWQVDSGHHIDKDLRENAALRLLKTFKPTKTIQCVPGDVLYIPPGTGHYGICEGESVTISVGIRNPTIVELMAEISEYIILESTPDVLETEIKEQLASIESGAIMQMIHKAISPIVLDTWYGCYVTRLRNPIILREFESGTNEKESTIKVDQEVKVTVVANRPTRLAWSKHDCEVLLFVNGDCYHFKREDLSWIPDFCQKRTFTINESNAGQLTLARELLEKGAINII